MVRGSSSKGLDSVYSSTPAHATQWHRQHGLCDRQSQTLGAQRVVHIDGENFSGVRADITLDPEAPDVKMACKALYSSKDTWMGPTLNMGAVPSIYNLTMDPYEKYDLMLNGASRPATRPRRRVATPAWTMAGLHAGSDEAAPDSGPPWRRDRRTPPPTPRRARSGVNGNVQARADDAEADVDAMLGLCRLVRDRAPGLWSTFLRFSSKAGARDEDAYAYFDFFGSPRVMHFLTRVGVRRQSDASSRKTSRHATD